MLFHKKTFIFAPENEMWKDLSSLQPQKKMLKHILFWRHYGVSRFAFLLIDDTSLISIFNYSFLISD